MNVALAQIRIDGGTQPRTAISEETVATYAEHMRAAVPAFPPVVLFFDGVDHWLGDGFHRYHAAKLAGRDSIAANIRTGTRRDAVLFAACANQTHGLPRTNADKRKAVLTLLEDEEWGQWTDGEISRKCGVTQPFVSELRRSLKTVLSDRTYITKHGTVATMHTENIGRRVAREQPSTDDEVDVADPVPFQRRRADAPPPSNGLQFARIAIMKLEEIRDNDSERQQAFDMVRRWLDAREAQAAMHA